MRIRKSGLLVSRPPLPRAVSRAHDAGWRWLMRRILGSGPLSAPGADPWEVETVGAGQTTPHVGEFPREQGRREALWHPASRGRDVLRTPHGECRMQNAALRVNAGVP